MRIRSDHYVIAIAIGLVFGLSNVRATTFCNMDTCGGEKGAEAQAKSAKGAALFFEAASKTFEMFAQIELSIGGDKNALDRAAGLSIESTALLEKAKETFQKVGDKTDSIQAVDSALKRLRDLEGVLRRGHIPSDSELASTIRAALEKGSIELLGICVKSIEELQSSASPMGSVYEQVRRREIPKSETLWQATNQLYGTLFRGRVVSLVFEAGR